VANVLIAGCGYVGTALGLELSSQGDRVWGVRRDASQLPLGLIAVSADLGNPATLQGLPRAMDYLVYCAGADEASDAAYERVYVNGLRNVLSALAGSGLRRVFFTSSTAVYGQAAGEWVDETSETTPAHFSGVRLLQAERLLLEHEVPATILRCSGIYGPGRTRLIDNVRQGTAMPSQRFTNRIHRDDVAGAIAHLSRQAEPPPLLLLSDDAPAADADVIGFLSQLLGVPPPPAGATASAATGRGGHKRCRNDRLRATGYQLRYPSYREGYAAMLTRPG
jgi:nucleoside-diphosphate-sugar epimerase